MIATNTTASLDLAGLQSGVAQCIRAQVYQIMWKGGGFSDVPNIQASADSPMRAFGY
jgi:hypothetical protein